MMTTRRYANDLARGGWGGTMMTTRRYANDLDGGVGRDNDDDT